MSDNRLRKKRVNGTADVTHGLCECNRVAYHRYYGLWECDCCQAARELGYREAKRLHERALRDDHLREAARAGLLKYLDWAEEHMIRLTP